MSMKEPVIEADLAIVNQLGLHSRPSVLVAEHSRRFKSDIMLSIDGFTADAKSEMQVMMLARQGLRSVAVKATGHDAESAVADLARLFASGFGEL